MPRGTNFPHFQGLRRLVVDLHFALVFMTRLPLPRLSDDLPPLARTMWAFPLVGAVVGGLGALTLGLAARLGIPLPVAAGLGLMTTVLVTGGLHEDGIADVADGFGASATRERRLEIMRDSRVGTFGVLAVIFSVGLRWAALCSFSSPLVAMAAMTLAATAGRTAQPLPLRLIPPARKDGLGAGAGKPGGIETLIALILAAALTHILFPGMEGPIMAVVLASGLGISALAHRVIGGYTGDVIGTTSQVSETATLILIATLLAGGAI